MYNTAGLMGLGGPELIAIAILAGVLFGGKAIGNLGKGVGEAIRGFKDALKEEPNIKKEVEELKSAVKS